MTCKLPKFSGKAFLAPMAGVSDPALRLLCKQNGAALVVTEFTSIHGIAAQQDRLQKQAKEISDFIEFSEKEKPLSVQLFGSDIRVLEKAAKIVEPFFDIIDYNMGCPAPHITQQMAGGALLQESNLTKQILKTLVQAVDKPVTLKMRAGVTAASRLLFKDIAQIAQEEGIQMITLHPRTVSQGYSGRADWSLITELKQLVDIPVVGNGDIVTPEDAKNMIEQTKCDYVMIGRGAMGNPFLFRQINDLLEHGYYTKYNAHQRISAFFDYLDYTKNYKIRFSNIKAQAMKFSKGLPQSTKLRHQITLCKNIDELQNIMQKISFEDPILA